MRKLVVLTFLSLDGVMQAPGGKGEDSSGGFDLEGWSVPYFDSDVGNVMAKQLHKPFDLLLGLTTYNIFASYWPQQGADNPLNKARKYVVTEDPISVDWPETIPLGGDAVGAIKKLKEEEGPMLQVHGSSMLIQTLLEHDLVDELWLKTFPITLGKGKKLFGEGTRPAAFELIRSSVSGSGVIMASYQRNGAVEVGTFGSEQTQQLSS